MARRHLVVLAVAVAAWVSLGAGARATYGARLTADEPQYVLSAISLAEDRDLDISDELAAKRWRAFHSPAELPSQTKILAGGRQISPHDPLLPLLLAAPVALGGWLGAKLTLAALAGVLAAVVAWLAHARLGVRPWLSLAGAAVLVGSPPLATYGTQVYPELPAALVVAAAIGLLTGRLERRGAGWLVVCVTALPWLSVKYAPVAAALAAVGLARLVRRGDRGLALGTAAALAAGGLVFVAGHRLLYGGWTAYATGDHFTRGEATVMGVSPDYLGRARRLAGLLVDREFGLVPWQPAYLLLVPAVGAALRRRPAWLAAVLAPLAAAWLVATFAALTMHGWWWPGRQVVVALPAAVLLVLWWADAAVRQARALLAAGAAGVVTFAWVGVEAWRGSLTLVVDFMTTTDPLYRAWRPLLPDGRSTHAGDLALQAAWVLGFAALAVWGWRGAPARPGRPPAGRG